MTEFSFEKLPTATLQNELQRINQELERLEAKKQQIVGVLIQRVFYED